MFLHETFFFNSFTANAGTCSLSEGERTVWSSLNWPSEWLLFSLLPISSDLEPSVSLSSSSKVTLHGKYLEISAGEVISGTRKPLVAETVSSKSFSDRSFSFPFSKVFL